MGDDHALDYARYVEDVTADIGEVVDEFSHGLSRLRLGLNFSRHTGQPGCLTINFEHDVVGEGRHRPIKVASRSCLVCRSNHLSNRVAVSHQTLCNSDAKIN